MTDGRQYQAGDTGMTELSGLDIKNLRHHYGIRCDNRHIALCDMALRTHDAEADRDNYRAKFHDAEQRAQRAEAECERKRKGLLDVFSILNETPVNCARTCNGNQVVGRWVCADSLEKITREALATPPPEDEPQVRQAERGNRPKDPTKGESNQCDGCARGLPLDEHGHHGDYMVCTADRYAPHAPEQARTELVGQVYELVDQIERTLDLFGGDDEGRSQATGAIDHARRVASPYNYNGGDTQQAHGDALKPCPFCGGRAQLKTGEEFAVAQCLSVSAHRLFIDGDNDAANEVTQMWNMRPSPDIPSRLPDRLRSIHAALDDHLGDSDVTHLDDGDEREQVPGQWAARELMDVIEDLERAKPAQAIGPLTALDELRGGCWNRAIGNWFDVRYREIRQALTASGVPEDNND